MNSHQKNFQKLDFPLLRAAQKIAQARSAQLTATFPTRKNQPRPSPGSAPMIKTEKPHVPEAVQVFDPQFS
jgi:hypothetical protein